MSLFAKVICFASSLCSGQWIGDAIAREKQIKAGSRETKNNLIRSINPTWKDLFEEIKDIMTE